MRKQIFRIDGYEMRPPKKAGKSGNSAVIYVPKSWLNKKVVAVRVGR